MQAETRSANRGARWLGAIIFGIGIAMLLIVLALAAATFAAVPEALAASSPSSHQGLGPALAATAARAAFLLVMAYVSSLVASKGLDLYVAARDRRGD